MLKPHNSVPKAVYTIPWQRWYQTSYVMVLMRACGHDGAMGLTEANVRRTFEKEVASQMPNACLNPNSLEKRLKQTFQKQVLEQLGRLEAHDPEHVLRTNCLGGR